MSNKDLSVEEILKACRLADGDGAASAPESTPAAEASTEKSTPVAAEKPAAPSKPAGQMSVEDMLAAARSEKSGGAAEPAAASPAAAPPAASSGPQKKPGEMSVAEMLAAARGEKTAAKPAPAAKAAPKAKTAAKAKTSPKAPAKPQPGNVPLDTASILAAARQENKPGPITKAEAAKREKTAPKPKAAPVMPEKPAYAKAPPPKFDEDTRRGFFAVLFGSFLAVGFSCLAAVSGIWGLGLARFMFPNILTEPPSKFKVGFPGDFAPDTVTTKYKAQFGVWIVNAEFEGMRQITALKSVCTHLGCTPNWLEGEQKFKCPCHGSGFYKDGVNFEGPAPRPLERYAISVADDGQIEIDKSKKFQQEMGQWSNTASYVKV